MAHATPRVENGTLLGGAAPTPPILVGTPEWYAWLSQETSFAFVGPLGRFTARKERRGRADGYWRAYRTSGGRVASVYLGKSADLSLERLRAADTALTAVHTSGQPHHSESRIPPPAPASQPPDPLPVAATPLLGRSDVSNAVVDTIGRDDVRLLTLTGPGGVGKTRLLLHVAAAVRERFADGVFFVDLAAIHDWRHVIPAIGQALGVTEYDGQRLAARLRSFLAAKQLLLLLDNFEHVLPAATELPELLAAAPQLKILVTSRAALRLLGEHERPVPPLLLPDDAKSAPLEHILAAPAVALFVQRAQAVRPDFCATAETAPIVAEICRRLDGLPLAIELAAARIRLFPPAALLGRLERRLPLLTGGARDLPPRQQTLRAAIDWSYQLLDPGAQLLLQRLAVFEGGAALDAIEAVCGPPGDVFDGLASLVGHSLVTVAVGGAEAPRYRLLDTVREYALEQLDASTDAAAARDRHAAYFLDLAERAEPALQSPDMLAWLDLLGKEHANVRVALRHLLSAGASERAAWLAAALLVFWDVRTHRSEGRAWLTAALDADELAAPIRAKVLWATGYLARAQFDGAAAVVLLQESLATARTLGDEPVLAAALTELGWTLVVLGIDTQQASEHLEEGLARHRALGDRRGVARALHGLGWVEEHRALDDTRGIVSARAGLAWVERRPGSLATARALHAESLALRRAARDAHGVAWSATNLATIAAVQQDYTAAHTFVQERLAIERTLDNRHGVANALHQLGMIALRQGDPAAANAQLVESLALGRAIGDTIVTALALLGLGEVYLAQAEPGQAAAVLEEAFARFRDMDDRHRMARAFGLLAQAALARGDEHAALELAAESVRLARSVDDRGAISVCLAGLADEAARRGAAPWAARLWGAAEREREEMASQLVPVEPPDRAALLQRARSALGAPAFAVAWDAGRALTAEDALATPPAEDASLAADGRAHRPAGLTARELEVLGLVASGLSNAQIAEQLVISVATVKTYLSAVYSKLGVSSRTAAMRYAIDRHL